MSRAGEPHGSKPRSREQGATWLCRAARALEDLDATLSSTGRSRGAGCGEIDDILRRVRSLRRRLVLGSGNERMLNALRAEFPVVLGCALSRARGERVRAVVAQGLTMSEA